MKSAASTDAFARYCCGDPDCPNDCEREQPPASSAAQGRDTSRLREFLSRPTLAPKLQKEHLATLDALEEAVADAERLIEHWSTHQLHADWVYEQSREWLRLYGRKAD